MFKQFIFLVLFSSCSLQAFENTTKSQSGFYVGGMLGGASTEETFDDEYVIDNSQFGFGVYGGYDFSSKWGIEFNTIITFIDDERPSVFKVEDTYLTAISFSPKINFDLDEKVTMYFKAGVGLLIYIEDYGDDDDYWEYSNSDSWAGIGFAAGAGFDLYVSDNVTFRLSIDYIEAELEDSSDNRNAAPESIDEKFTFTALSMHYHF